MNFKALALTALAVAATAAPAAANSFKFAGMKQYTADNFSHPTVKQIANHLHRIGVPILDGLDNGFNQCMPQANGMVAMGFYSPDLQHDGPLHQQRWIERYDIDFDP